MRADYLRGGFYGVKFEGVQTIFTKNFKFKTEMLRKKNIYTVHKCALGWLVCWQGGRWAKYNV